MDIPIQVAVFEVSHEHCSPEMILDLTRRSRVHDLWSGSAKGFFVMKPLRFSSRSELSLHTTKRERERERHAVAGERRD